MLSIDIDGNDYYVWDAINIIKPRVVVIEYNGKFPPDCDWKMAYNEQHIWDGSDWHGASLKALEKLGSIKGYQLVGTNITGANAFFVKKSLASNLFYNPPTSEALYNPLRLNIMHRNGHPAKYCLKDQEDNLGILNYFPSNIAILENGFHDLEGSGNDQFAWMKEQKGSIIVRVDKEKSVEIEIPWFISENALKTFQKPYEFIVSCYKIDNSTEILFQTKNICSRCQGILKIPLAIEQNAVRISIELSSLWKPSEILGTTDDRDLGIAIQLRKIRVIQL